MADLLDSMREGPKPTWRNGQPGKHRPSVDGDLLWIANDYRAPRLGGKWFRFDQGETIWRCLDPFNQTGINSAGDTPPPVDRYGRLPMGATL